MPLEPDLTQAKQAEAEKQFTAFLAALSPAWDFDFRLLWPKSHPLPFKCEPAIDARLDNQNEAFDDLRDMNEGGYGIYVVVNETDGEGVKTANVVRVRACFADLDDGLPDRAWPLPPSMLVQTSANKFQAYWLLADRMTVEQFAQVEARLVADYGADPNAVDLARVLRVPGFANTKGEPFPVRFAIEPTGEVYTAAELVAAFPPIAKAADRKPQKPSPVNQPVNVAVLKSALDHLAAIPHPAVKRLDHRHGGGLSTSYADSYDAWWKFGIAIYRALGDDGFPLWDAWSKSSRTYPGIEASRAKWETFAAGARHDDACTVGSVFHAAKRHGWSHSQAMTRSLLSNALSKFNNQKKMIVSKGNE